MFSFYPDQAALYVCCRALLLSYRGRDVVGINASGELSWVLHMPCCYREPLTFLFVFFKKRRGEEILLHYDD